MGTVMREKSSEATSPAINEMASPWKMGSKRITDAENKRKMIDQQITQRLQEIRSRLK